MRRVPTVVRELRIPCRAVPVRWSGAALATAILALAGCGSTPKPPEVPSAGGPPSRGGGYYLDDGPGANPPPNLHAVPDAVPRTEPLRTANMRPYEAMGKTYRPMTELKPFRQRGIASWYGRRYHGRPTASGEIYDMYAMTAAHPTLPIPSYVRVTHVVDGKTVVVRVNDRGPFHSERIIDLSYTAAYKLGILAGGSALVEVETIIPGETPPTRTADAPAPPPGVVVSALPAPQVVAEPLPAPAGPAASPVPPGESPTATAAVPPQPAAPRADNPPVATAGNGHFLQLGAFGSRENAESYLGRARAELAWLAESLQLYFHDNLFRVQSGPYPDASSAREVADRIGATFNVKPVLVTR
ncbi:MAG: septal ring lytic transglycosylase RlpA family protein [Pseudomonadota bacterium]